MARLPLSFDCLDDGCIFIRPLQEHRHQARVREQVSQTSVVVVSHDLSEQHSTSRSSI